MSLIERNDFQILRGGVPGNYEGCHDAVLDIDPAITDGVMSGECVMWGANGYVKASMTAAKVPFYMVIEGNSEADSYAGAFVNKATGIRGTFRAQVKIAAGNDGDFVSLEDGAFVAVDGTHAAVGQILSRDAVSGIAVIDMY